ncbi:GIY-YIG nuclease family protein [Sporosarcina oncorhynchi]|uniref:GIY-YIG nuclease family protein n=1 Tax=Sporosarcina oncorhynchi TaxID=3056444 RepID=A0ABZ0L4U2_9BACL|nr:GIY-YIG nuclease family protein [Sporosarcina sp. T2O-4]WOV87609.1 GIY-YIG nuclease family protein [Sporosarcina sp. T2O-4]
MDKRNNHFFYVLECGDGSYYAGYTNNLEKRVLTHNEGKGAKYTRAKLPVHCIYHEVYETKRAAMQAEYRFKQLTRQAKKLHMRKGKQTDEIPKER